MRKILSAVAGLVLAVGFTSIAAKASASGSIGCGGGNGASAPCNGQGLGTVTESGGLLSSTGIDVNLTGVTGLSSAVSSLPVFTPNTDQFNFGFSNVGYSYSNGGTFSFTDLTEPGVLTVTGEAEFGSTPPGNLTGTLSIVLDATHYSFNYGGISASGNINVSGVASLTLDPGNVTSMTGSVGLPSVGGTGSGTGTTPEPGTLLLLGSGMTALGFIRRKFARA